MSQTSDCCAWSGGATVFPELFPRPSSRRRRYEASNSGWNTGPMWSYQSEPRKIFLTLHDRGDPEKEIVVDVMEILMIKDDTAANGCTLYLGKLGPISLAESAREVMRAIKEAQEPEQP